MLLLNYLPDIILGQLLLISVIGNIWLLKAYKNVTKNLLVALHTNHQTLITEAIADDSDPTLLIAEPTFKTEADPLLEKPAVIETDEIKAEINTATEIETPQGTVTLFATETAQAQQIEIIATKNTDQNIKELLDQISEIEEQLKIKSETTA